MIHLPQYKGKTVALLGLGKTGISTAEALLASGAQVVLWDDKPESLTSLPVGLASHVQHYDAWDWSALAAVIMSPGIPFTHPEPHAVVGRARANDVRISSDIELLYEAQPDAKYVAITGTNGKSTTTALIGHILREAGRNVQVGGNIGYAALALQPLHADGIYVLELSSYQLDLLQHTRFQIAVWLNISPDHLDRHGDMEGYIAAKRAIFEHQQAGDVAVIGVDDAYSEAVARQQLLSAGASVVPIATTQQPKGGVWVKGARLHDAISGQEADLSSLQTLRGEHNHQNAAAAYAACAALGVSHEQIVRAMHSFAGLAHRMQLVAKAQGVHFVNDSKATNADAAAKSLGSFEEIYWIAGGVAKAGGIASLAPYFPRIRKAYLIGEAQESFAQTLEGVLAFTRSGTLEAATRAAYNDAVRAGGGVVLLAPACASFDQFQNFEHRGDCFAALATQLVKEHG